MQLDEYVEKLERFAGDPYGRQFRSRFAGIDGRGELGVLQSPSREELEQIRRAVAIMTGAEKANAADLDEKQIRRIAADAQADPALIAIFLNGFALENRKEK
jgi:signal recognition particle GTPase